MDRIKINVALKNEDFISTISFFGGVSFYRVHPIERHEKQKAKLGAGLKENLIFANRITSFKTSLKEKHAARKSYIAKEKVYVRSHLRDFQALTL